jgi:ribonuclease M5
MMNKIKIQETIIVEGKHDESKIKSLVDADVLVTNGTHVSKDFIALVQRIGANQGIIIFTDPDTPGKQIRNKLMSYVPNAKHAMLTQKQKNVGVEHALDVEILEALQQAKAWTVKKEQSIKRDDFNALGLSGAVDSSYKREKLSVHYRLPKGNAKQLFKLLNMLEVTKQEIEAIL